jgi:hypothetical protein
MIIVVQAGILMSSGHANKNLECVIPLTEFSEFPVAVDSVI